MTLTAHSLIAAAIISKVSNPIVGLPLVFASHFVMDKVPHWDVMTDKGKSNKLIAIETLMDIILGFSLAAIFFFLKPGIDPVYFFLGILISQSPDLLEAPYVIPKLKNPVSAATYKFQHVIHDLWFDARKEAPWGIITQLAFIAVFLLWAIL